MSGDPRSVLTMIPEGVTVTMERSKGRGAPTQLSVRPQDVILKAQLSSVYTRWSLRLEETGPVWVVRSPHSPFFRRGCPVGGARWVVGHHALLVSGTFWPLSALPVKPDTHSSLGMLRDPGKEALGSDPSTQGCWLPSGLGGVGVHSLWPIVWPP